MDDLIERAARLTYDVRPYGDEDAHELTWENLDNAWKDVHRQMASAVVNIVLEEAAKVADADAAERAGSLQADAGQRIAAAIRSLSSKGGE